MAGRGDEGVAWLRSQRAHILSRDRTTSLDAALSPILAALDLLGLLPQNLTLQFPASRWSTLTQTEPSDAAKAYLLSSGWLSDAQRQFLVQIAVDWADVLSVSDTAVSSESTLQRQLLRAVFRPDIPASPSTKSQRRGRLIALFEEATDDSAGDNDAASERLAAIGHVIACGLSATTQILKFRTQVQEDGSVSFDCHPFTIEGLSFALELLVKDDGQARASALEATLTAALHINNLAQRQKFWTDATKELCAVPARICNIFGRGDMPKALHDASFFAALAHQFEGLIDNAASMTDAESSSARLSLVKEVFEKLIRSGVTSRALEGALTKTAGQDESDFFRGLLQAVLKRTQPTRGSTKSTLTASYRMAWHRLLRSLDSFDSGVRFLMHLLAYIDHCCFVSRQLGDLVTASERSRAGAEGRAFLSTTTATTSLVLIHLLQLFIPLPSDVKRPRPLESTDSRFKEVVEDEEADEDDEDDHRRFIAVLFGEAQNSTTSTFCLSSAMARALAIAVCTGSNMMVNMTSVDWALGTIISRWSSKERIHRASLAEEQFLTTILLSILALCPASDPLAGQTLMSADFINSIGSHIGHQDPAIRRHGMLVAELFEEASKRSNTQASSSSKRLDFGASTWNGRGDGKEATRVLRAMVLGWSASNPLRQELPTQQDGLTAINDAQNPINSYFTGADVRSANGCQSSTDNRASREHVNFIRDEKVVDKTSSKTLRAYELPDESDLAESSSSESDSDSDLGEETLGSAAKSGNKKDEDASELLDVHVLKKKQRRRPVYVSELVPLLRSNERKDNRKGLKAAEELIRRKTGWGMEIEESAVELALALAALQNNWSTKFFEERRTGALAALVVAAPRTACGCLVEQYFSGYYSIVQRMSILNAIVEAARELSEKNGNPTGLVAKAGVGASAYTLVKDAATDARQYGEQKYSEVRQAAAVNILRAPQQVLISETKGAVARATPATKDGRPLHVAALAGARLSKLPRYVDIASSVFIFPLLNRFWAILQDASRRQSRMLGGSSGRGSRGNGRQAPWQGAGMGSVLSAPAVGALLDALSVLASLARNALDFQRVVVPELLELSLVTPRLMLPLLGGSSPLPGGGIEDSDDMMLIHQGALSLAVILIDAARAADSARFLKREKAMLLDELTVYASEIFKAEQGKQQQPGGPPMSRAGGASATLYLRLEEIQTT
ncbi:telomere binding protein [Tilletia horrida]|nr:telomere binding protein [Tilletia horrida]